MHSWDVFMYWQFGNGTQGNMCSQYIGVWKEIRKCSSASAGTSVEKSSLNLGVTFYPLVNILFQLRSWFVNFSRVFWCLSMKKKKVHYNDATSKTNLPDTSFPLFCHFPFEIKNKNPCWECDWRLTQSAHCGFVCRSRGGGKKQSEGPGGGGEQSEGPEDKTPRVHPK